MKEKYLKIASNFSVTAIGYASQANAVLGIRDSGKTYTAMKCAEQLLLSKIPIIVYDPVGIWKNIRVGVGNKKGFPVIVAGGDASADILLTPDNAVQIVRAAMRAGISLIVDLYSPSLANKSKWIKIVQETMDVLMYENRDYGLRHIFIEEAAEFIPQRIQPQQAKVYSSIERVARMGRNASLGMTVINQRAEEINKAILELCAMMFLHKQVGKNSLLSINKWFDILGWNESKANLMIRQLPALNPGECFILDTNDGNRDIMGAKLRSKILPKQTFHPSPEKGVPLKAAKSNVNVSQFIKKLNAELHKKNTKQLVKLVKAEKGKSPAPNSTDLTAMEKKFREELLQKEKTISIIKASNVQYKDQLLIAKQEITRLVKLNDDKVHLCQVASLQLAGIIKEKKFVSKVQDVKPIPIGISFPSMKASTSIKSKQLPSEPSLVSDLDISPNGKDSALNRMIKGVSMFPEAGISKSKLAILCGMSPTSGTFGVYHRKLKRDYIIMVEGSNFYPTTQGANLARSIPALKTSLDDILDNWYGILGRDSGLTRILKAVAKGNGNAVEIETIEAETSMSGSSGTFGVYKRRLRRYGLIEISRDGFRLSPNLLMPYPRQGNSPDQSLN